MVDGTSSKYPHRYPLGLKVFDNILQADKPLRSQHIERLRELSQREDVDIFAARDAHAFDRPLQRTAR
ncbi:hypothetical protein [Mycobacteroides chelonae]|uniref:hypothetical protein n=1 Tax=Mycobacteroides chelonae TaxID=1774 RepID=UPI0012FF8A96|nr:hypothetical protein [Mycobacteroides chelonae]